MKPDGQPLHFAKDVRMDLPARIFDAMLSSLPDLVFAFDREAKVVYANEPLLTIWGLRLSEAVGKSLFELDYPEELAVRLTDQLLEVVATGLSISGEVIYRGIGGGDDIHDYTYNPVFDANGAVMGVAGSTRLVTQRRAAELAARRLAAIVESSGDAIISKDLDGTIRTWNAGAERLFGYSAEEIVGRSVMLLIPDDRRNEETEILGRIGTGQGVEHFETIRRRKDGSLVPISLSVSPIRDPNGTVVGASKIARDITEQRAIAAALREAKEAAEAANRSKDQFLAVLSHELRTPLTPALMMVSALEQDPALPVEVRRDMSVVRRNIELETKLIDDLLDISRITSGKLKLHLQPVDLNETVREVCGTCEEVAASKGVTLDLDLAADAGAVRADSARLQQMLWNLLNNAVKFTPEGGRIFVATTRLESGNRQISVRDTGAGIAPEVLPKIFDAFEQGSERVTRQFGGMGLGLAITKGIAELQHGRIFAESPGVGQGSTFFLELPQADQATLAPASAPCECDPVPGASILLVEDHRDTGAALGRYLENAGFRVSRASSVNEAFDLANERDFDLILSDLGLPDGSGCDLMRRLRDNGIAIKGVAMSGYGMEEDVQRSLAAGFLEHLVKPLDLPSIQSAIKRALG